MSHQCTFTALKHRVCFKGAHSSDTDSLEKANPNAAECRHATPLTIQQMSYTASVF